MRDRTKILQGPSIDGRYLALEVGKANCRGTSFQEGGMMDGGWDWGLRFGRYVPVIIAILLVIGLVYSVR